MKLKDIKGLLPTREHLLSCNCKVKDVDFILDLLAEREIEVSVCKKCGGSGLWELPRLHPRYPKCPVQCTNGIVIKVKESR